jgi:hypothetical protein
MIDGALFISFLFRPMLGYFLGIRCFFMWLSVRASGRGP